MTDNDLFSRREILTPSSLNREIRSLLEGRFGLVWLEGEISNLSTPASGHAYFTLKDAAAQVRCALFRNRNTGVRLSPGMQIVVRARVSLYEARGEYQLIVESVEPAGEGLLRLEFEALKKRLAAEGLFDPDEKRPLATFPKHLAVITSPTGAAWRDVQSVIARRYPVVKLTLCPSLVQGDTAPGALKRALKNAIALNPDAILLTRGGGSLEDLWAFNDEGLARAVADSPVPVVSAVGHEVDFSICDFVADVRAATPSAAAELLVPDSAELLNQLSRLSATLGRRLRASLTQRQLRLGELGQRLTRAQPASRINNARGRLAELRQRLTLQQSAALTRSGSRLSGAQHRLRQQHPGLKIGQHSQRVGELKRRCLSSGMQLLNQRQQQLDSLARALKAISPLAVLQRGYSVTTTGDGRVLRSASEVRAGQTITSTLASGELQAVVSATSPSSPEPGSKNEDNGPLGP